MGLGQQSVRQAMSAELRHFLEVPKYEVERGGFIMLVPAESFDPNDNRICLTCLSWLHESMSDEGGFGHYCTSCGGGAKVGHRCYDCHDIG